MPDRRSVLAGILAAAAAPARSADAPRRFRLGTTLWPPDLTLGAILRVRRFVGRDCDMVAPMILGGVPWGVAPIDYSGRLLGELGYRAPEGHAVLLSLGPLNTMRTGLAPYFGERDNLPLPDDFAGLPFDDPKVVASYVDFCQAAADATRPDWLCTAVEANILLHARPGLWPGFLRLMAAVHAALKASHPRLVQVISIAWGHFEGLVDGTDRQAQAAGMAEAAAYCDMLGWSVYPHAQLTLPVPLPETALDGIAAFGAATGRPCAVTECGFASRPNRFQPGITLPGSEELQAGFLRHLLDVADRDRLAFVVNWTSHDYPDLMDDIPEAERKLASVWTWTGLVGPQGQDKAATPVWRATLARPFG
jgi:hypothetical protein